MLKVVKHKRRNKNIGTWHIEKRKDFEQSLR